MRLVDWIRAPEEKKYIVVARKFSEFLGRLGFVSHLAPLYAWSAAVSPSAVGKVADTVILMLRYILADGI